MSPLATSFYAEPLTIREAGVDDPNRSVRWSEVVTGRST